MFTCTHSVTETRHGRWRCLACGEILKPRQAPALASGKEGVQDTDKPQPSTTTETEASS